MKGRNISWILWALAIIVCQQVATVGQLSNREQAIAFAVYLETHASRLEKRADVCVAFGHGLSADEKAVLAELKQQKLKVRPGDWCNEGPRGLVISVIAPISEPVPGTYEVKVEVGDLRAIRGGAEHFATLVRRGTYTVKCKEGSEPELIRYEQTAQPGR